MTFDQQQLTTTFQRTFKDRCVHFCAFVSNLFRNSCICLKELNGCKKIYK